MVLHYLGAAKNEVDYYLKKVFDLTDEKHLALKESMNSHDFQKLIFDPEVKKKYVPWAPEDLLPHNIIEDNRFAAPFIEAFFPDAGIRCRTKWDDIDTVMEQQVLKGLPVILFIGTTSVTVQLAAFAVGEEEGRDPLKTFLERHTQVKSDTRIQWTEDLGYEELCQFKEDYQKAEGILQKPSSPQEEKEKALRTIAAIREEINRAAIARSHSHFVVVRGFTEDEVIINDPWGHPAMDENGRVLLDSGGRWNYYDRRRASPFGDNIRVKREDFKKRYTDDGSCFLWLLEKDRLWDFIYPRTLPQDRKPVFQDFLACYRQEEQFGGGYPIRRTFAWHAGLHIKGDRTAVHPMGPGTLVAARIKNGTEEEGISRNGSSCFVLLRHNLLIEGELKNFYSLYYHLAPLQEDDLDSFQVKEESPGWLKNMASRCFRRAIAGHGAAIFHMESHQQLGILAHNSSVLVEDILEKEIQGKSHRVIRWDLNGTKVYSHLNRFRTLYDPREGEMETYREKIRLLKRGETVYFDDLPDFDDTIEVGSGQSLGKTGSFYGYRTLVEEWGEGLVHWEVFSDDLLFSSPEKEGFVLEDASGEDETVLLHARHIIKKLRDSNAFSLGDFRDLHSGFIRQKEYLDFYSRPHNRMALADYIFIGFNEWSDKVDWKTAYENSIGFSRVGYNVDSPEETKFCPLPDYLELIRKPHTWLNDRALTAMAPQSETLLREGKAVHYHPIRFLQWLCEQSV